MKVHFGFDQWDGTGVRSAVTLGNFDGVHLGHQKILNRVVELSKQSSIPSVAITFDPVPKKILQPQTAPPLIQTLEQRLASLQAIGLDHTIVVKFSPSFASKTPEQFVREFLIDMLHIKYFVVGENFAFGHQKQGDLKLLKRLGSLHDFHAEGISEIFKNGVRISSSQIRDFIMQGKMKEANDFLGSPFTLTGTVVEGERLGSRLGIPTANLDYENEIVPGKGVYACRSIIANGSHLSATNVGTRPTFQGSRLTVEAHLLDYSGDLYGSRMDLQFLDKLRDEMRFSNVDHLKVQILTDIQRVRSYEI